MKRYTEKEEKYILKEISKGYGNLSKTFNKIAKKLGRSPNAIHYKWYYEFSNPEHKKYVGVAFMLAAKESVLVNRKISRKTNIAITTESNSLLSKYLHRIFDYIKKII